MRLRIKRRIRTETSEQWTLFDADNLDSTGSPQNIGKLDLHYDPEMIYATLLLWSEFVGQLEEDVVKEIIDDLLDEVTEPIGVPTEYSLDYFSPSLAEYKFFTNYDEDEDYDAEDLEDDEETEDDTDDKPKNGSSWR